MIAGPLALYRGSYVTLSSRPAQNSDFSSAQIPLLVKVGASFYYFAVDLRGTTESNGIETNLSYPYRITFHFVRECESCCYS